MNDTLRGQIPMDLVTTAGWGHRIPVRLAFHQATPWAVELTIFVPGGEPVRWSLSRELLLDGLSTVAGEGDVQVRPLDRSDDDLVAITLRSPEGEADLLAPLAALHAYLLRTDLLVPFGEEFSEEWLDRGIARLLTEPELRN